MLPTETVMNTNLTTAPFKLMFKQLSSGHLNLLLDLM